MTANYAPRFLSALCWFALFALAACSTPAPFPASPGQAGLNVLAAETFLADIAQNVAGDRVQVHALLPIGADPHSFEPTPNDIRAVAASNLLIVNGAGFEGFVSKMTENAGGKRTVVEAAAGLTSRKAREGEVAEMSDADLTDSICASAAAQSQAVASGAEAAAAPLLGESGLFEITLRPRPEGGFVGFLRYGTDENGDFQIASNGGTITVLAAASGKPVSFEKALPLKCGGLTQGNLVPLSRDTPYLLQITGATEKLMFSIGPAGSVHTHEGDPHFWLDPTNTIHYVDTIRAALAQADPAGAAEYAANAAAYTAKLTALDAWIQEQVATVPPERRLLVTNHESLGYFADRYGFRIVGTIVPSVSTDSSPSAQQLARLVARVKTTGARAIFLETGTNPQLAQQLAGETGIRVVTDLYTHSISAATGPAPTYLEMLRYDVTQIVNTLK